MPGRLRENYGAILIKNLMARDGREGANDNKSA